MNYESKTTIQSKAVPGVTFTLKKPNIKRRLAYSAQIADKQDSLRAMDRERKPLIDEYRAAVALAEAAAKPEMEALMASESISREEAKRRVKLNFTFDADKFEEMAFLAGKQQEFIARDIYPVMVRCFVTKIDGLDIDGKPATVDSLIEDGRDELYTEILEAVRAELGLADPEKENLGSAGTSAPPVGGPAKTEPAAIPTTAETAESAATT